jgi:histone H3/H4
MLTVRTQIKDILRESGDGIENMSKDFMSKLDEEVRELVITAAKRAKENGRRTVMAKDV